MAKGKASDLKRIIKAIETFGWGFKQVTTTENGTTTTVLTATVDEDNDITVYWHFDHTGAQVS